MAVAFGDFCFAIERCGQRARFYDAWIRPEAHRAALLRYFLLRLHDVDHRVGRLRRILRGVRALRSEQIARRLYHHHVEAVADAENRDVVLARVADRADHSLGAALAE